MFHGSVAKFDKEIDILKEKKPINLNFQAKVIIKEESLTLNKRFY